MARRKALNQELIKLLGSSNVYFNPPESIKLKYPCVVYNESNKNLLSADNKKYRLLNQYQLTVIDRDADHGSAVTDAILESLQYCSLEREFIYDELNHWVLRLFY